MKNKKNYKLGFTLLELLVVVLIIGILAAIVLPQYQLAVDKADFTKYQSIVQSIRNAYQEYVLAKGTTPNNFDDLSINMSNDFQVSDKRATYTYTCLSNKTTHCCMRKNNNGFNAAIYCLKQDYTLGYYEEILTPNFNPMLNKNCIAKYQSNNKNSRAYRLCLHKASPSTKTMSIHTPYTGEPFGIMAYHMYPM